MKAIATLTIILAGVLAYHDYTTNQERNKVDLKNVLMESENRLLKDQITELNFKITSTPTYDDGQRDILVRMGAPNSPNAYQDGYNAALKITQPNEFANGYHTALKQFEFDTNKSTALVPYKDDNPKLPEPKK